MNKLDPYARTIDRRWYRTAQTALHAAFSERSTRGEPIWIARIPSTKTWILALGAVHEVSGVSVAKSRLEALRAFAWNVRDIDPPPDPLLASTPRIVGGRAFSPRRQEGPWEAFPSEWWWIPRVLVVESEADTWVGEARSAALGQVRLPAQARFEDESRSSYEHRVTRARQDFGEGFEKVVLARSKTLEYAFDVRSTLASLADAEPNAFCFALGRAGLELFAGATPELLVETTPTRVRSVALAGTRPAGASEAELLGSIKDLEEHEYVADALAEAFGSGPNVRKGPTQIRRTGTLLHLATDVEAELAQPSLFKWIETLHPTPAVAGTPRGVALEYLKATEPLERGWYAGAVGYLAPSHGAAWVGIRSALFRQDSTTLFAGAGVVRGSRPEEEWNETESKLQAMERCLRRSHGR